jgi:hypothetical protein
VLAKASSNLPDRPSDYPVTSRHIATNAVKIRVYKPRHGFTNLLQALSLVRLYVTIWSRGLCEKLTVAEQVKNIHLLSPNIHYRIYKRNGAESYHNSTEQRILEELNVS